MRLTNVGVQGVQVVLGTCLQGVHLYLGHVCWVYRLYHGRLLGVQVVLGTCLLRVQLQVHISSTASARPEPTGVLGQDYTLYQPLYNMHITVAAM